MQILCFKSHFYVLRFIVGPLTLMFNYSKLCSRNKLLPFYNPTSAASSVAKVSTQGKTKSFFCIAGSSQLVWWNSGHLLQHTQCEQDCPRLALSHRSYRVHESQPTTAHFLHFTPSLWDLFSNLTSKLLSTVKPTGQLQELQFILTKSQGSVTKRKQK